MTNTNDTRSSTVGWQADALRFTAFPLGNVEIDHGEWWRQLVGQQAEIVAAQRSTGIRQAEGPFRDGKLVLVVLPDRYEWRYHTPDISELPPKDVLTLGEFRGALETFVVLVNDWLELGIGPSVSRLAFGAHLLKAWDDQREAFRDLGEYLPFDGEHLEGSVGFLYQINRRIKSDLGIADLEINRLAKWQAREIVRARVRMQGGPEVVIDENVLRELQVPMHTANLEVDINNVPMSLPDDRLHEIFEELVTLGAEIAEKGDVG